MVAPKYRPHDLFAEFEEYGWHHSYCDAYGGTLRTHSEFWRDEESPPASALDDRSIPCTCGFRDVLDRIAQDRKQHQDIAEQMKEGD